MTVQKIEIHFQKKQSKMVDITVSNTDVDIKVFLQYSVLMTAK